MRRILHFRSKQAAGFDLSGLLRSVGRRVGNGLQATGTGLRNLATGVTRPGDALVPGTPMYDRLIPPAVQQTTAVMLPPTTPLASTRTLLQPAGLADSAIRPVVQAMATPSAAGTYAGAYSGASMGALGPSAKPGQGVMAINRQATPRQEAMTAAHEASHAQVEASRAGLPAPFLASVPAWLGASPIGPVRAAGAFADELLAHTRGGGLPAAAGYAVSGSRTYADQLARHSPAVAAAYRTVPFVLGGGAALSASEWYRNQPMPEPQLDPQAIREAAQRLRELAGPAGAHLRLP